MRTLSGEYYLIEVDHKNSIGTLETSYFSTGDGYVDISNGITYLPLVLDAGAISEFLFGDGTINFSGKSVSYARVILNNTSRRLDYFLLRYMVGFQIRFYKARLGETKEFIYSGLIDAVDLNTSSVTISVKNPIDTLKNKVALNTFYAGTNDNVSIFVEGDSNLKGKPKPLLLGDCSNANISPVLVNSTYNIYQISCLPVAEITSVMIGRTVQTLHNTATSLAALQAEAASGTIPSSKYSVYLGGSASGNSLSNNETGAYIALGTDPEKPLTVNAIEGYKNLVLYNEDLSNAAWVASNVTKTSSSITTLPNGLVSATGGGYIVETTANAVHSLTQNITITTGKHVFISALVRRHGSADGVQMRFTSGANTDYINLNFKAYGSASSNTSYFFWHVDQNWTLLSIRMDTSRAGTSGSTLSFRMLKDSLSNNDPSTYTDSYAGSTSNGCYIWSSQVVQASNYYYNATPLISYHYLPPRRITTSAADYNNSVFNVLWNFWEYTRQVYNTSDYLLQRFNFSSFYQLDDTDYSYVNSKAGIFLSEPTDTIGSVLNQICDPIKISIVESQTADGAGSYSITPYARLFSKLYYLSGSTPTIDERMLLGSPKIKYALSSDTPNNTKISNSIINYNRNYTLMSESDLYGSVLSDMPYVSEEYRTYKAGSGISAGLIPTATNETIATILQTETDATIAGNHRVYLYSEGSTLGRIIAEIMLPESYATSLGLDLGSMVLLENNTFCIIGKTKRFPIAGKTEATVNVVKFQLWR